MALTRRTFAVLGLVALASTACGLTPRAPGPAAEAKAPAFTLPDHRGAQVSLADLTRHGPAVLVFYRGYW